MTLRTSLFLGFTSILLCACTQMATDQTVGTSSISTAEQVVHFDTPKANNAVSDPVRGKETSLWICPMEGANGTLANGVATAHYFEKGMSVIGIQLNIAVAPNGSYYEAWLQSSNGEEMSIGKMQNTENDVRYSVRFESPKNLQGYTNILIKMQAAGSTSGDGKIVAKGILKDTKR